MTVFLVIGGAGIALLVLALVIGDVLDGMFDSVEGLLDSDIFSTAGLAGLFGGFGFGGAIGLGVTGVMLVAIITGLLLGAGLAFGATWLTRMLRNQSNSHTVSTNSIVGSSAQVITAIPDGGYGQIRLSHNGHLLTFSARSAVPLPPGTRVWVSEVISATAVTVQTIDFTPDSITP